MNRIIPGSRISPCQVTIHIFKIRQVNIDGAFERSEGFSLVIAIGVVYPNGIISKGMDNRNDHFYLWNEMRRGYKSYPVDPEIKDFSDLPDNFV